MDQPTTVQANHPNVTPAANHTKRKIVGTEQMLPTIHDLNVTTHKNVKWTPLSHNQQANPITNQKTNYAAPMLWGNSRREGVFSTRTPTTYTNDTTVECSGTPSEAWLRQQAIASMKRHPPQEDQKATHTEDQDYRNACQNHEQPPFKPTSTTKELSTETRIDQIENAPDVHTASQMSEEDIHGSTQLPIFHDNFPTFLNSIEEYVTEKDGSTYILLHSTIPLKKRRRMLYLPLEFGEIIMDGLVDSGAFIKAMSLSDYNAIKMNSDNCVIKDTHRPLSRLNAQMPN